jgi:hypothetical protein
MLVREAEAELAQSRYPLGIEHDDAKFLSLGLKRGDSGEEAVDHFKRIGFSMGLPGLELNTKAFLTTIGSRGYGKQVHGSFPIFELYELRFSLDGKLQSIRRAVTRFMADRTEEYIDLP